jgi:hypothetical protein
MTTLTKKEEVTVFELHIVTWMATALLGNRPRDRINIPNNRITNVIARC